MGSGGRSAALRSRAAFDAARSAARHSGQGASPRRRWRFAAAVVPQGARLRLFFSATETPLNGKFWVSEPAGGCHYDRRGKLDPIGGNPRGYVSHFVII